MTAHRVRDALAAITQAREEREQRAPTLWDALEEQTAHAPAVVTPKERAIARAGRHASDQWKEAAFEAVRAAALRHPDLTVDDVHPFLSEQTHDLRALGPVMLRAAREGVIERAKGEYRISERPETHARPLAVWRSLICLRTA